MRISNCAELCVGCVFLAALYHATKDIRISSCLAKNMFDNFACRLNNIFENTVVTAVIMVPGGLESSYKKWTT